MRSRFGSSSTTRMLGMPPILPARMIPVCRRFSTRRRSFSPVACSAIALIIFAECGLLIGFFLPGDSLLFTAGFLASQRHDRSDIWTLSAVCGIAAVIGPLVGYWYGQLVGPAPVQSRGLAAVPQAAPDARARVLRAPRRQGADPGPLHPDRAHVCPGGGGHGGDELPTLRRLHRDRRARSGPSA